MSSKRPRKILRHPLYFFAAILATSFGATVFDPEGQNAQAGDFSAEVSLGLNVSKDLLGRASDYDGGFRGGREVVNFAARWESDSRKVFVELRHTSHLRRGYPFNERPEDFLDQLLVGYRFTFTRR